MNYWKMLSIATAMAILPLLVSCSAPPTEHYVSPRIQGEAQRINLEEVQKAFWETKGKDFNGWMSAFEKRVNEIFDGKEIISIDASRGSGRLVVTGYINKIDKDGFQPGDEKLFAIEQTGDAANNELPYRVSGSDGRPYYEGHHSILDNPFIQMMVFSHLMGGIGGGWGGHYYTPPQQVVVLERSRDQWRSSPSYQQQQASNHSFFSRFKTNQMSGALESRNRFGNQSFSSTASATTNGTPRKRSWLDGTSSSSSPSFNSTSSSIAGSNSSTSSPSSGWGGKRSSSSSLFSPGGGFSTGRRSWGGRRR